MLVDNKQTGRQALLRYSTTFLLLFVSLQFLYQTSRDTELHRFWLEQLTVVPSAAVISWITPQETVIAQGHSLRSPYVRLSVFNGCEGTEVILLLVSALLALRLPWRQTLSSIFLGVLLVYVVNQARIITLYYCLRFDRSLFDSLHGIIAPLAIIAIATLFFLYWVPHDRSQRNA